MRLTRVLLCLAIVVLLLSYCSDAQQEIRKAVRAKANRKIKEGNQKIQRGKQVVRKVKNQAKAPFTRAAAKINAKYQNTKRKAQAIEQIINS